MEDVNLVYVFLNNNFLSSSTKEENQYSYDQIPEYYIDTLNYNSKKVTNVYFILQEEVAKQIKHKIPSNVEIVLAEKLTETEEFKEVSRLLSLKWNRYLSDPFWYNTFIRVILFCILQRQLKLQNCLHLEADNLLLTDDFSDLKDFKDCNFGYPKECPFSSAPCFIFSKSSKAATAILNDHLILLNEGEQNLRHRVGWFATWITDMAFLDLIATKNDNYKTLHSLPVSEDLRNLYDPTSYGMYLGGTNNGHEVGFIDERHYVGRHLKNKNIKVKWKDKRVVVEHGGVEFNLTNLHVHNKSKIKEFIQHAT